MEPDRVTASIGVTRNLGDYNNVKLDFSWESQVAKDETFEQAAQRVWDAVEKQVEEKLNEYE